MIHIYGLFFNDPLSCTLYDRVRNPAFCMTDSPLVFSGLHIALYGIMIVLSRRPYCYLRLYPCFSDVVRVIYVQWLYPIRIPMNPIRTHSWIPHNLKGKCYITFSIIALSPRVVHQRVDSMTVYAHTSSILVTQHRPRPTYTTRPRAQDCHAPL